MICTPKVGPKSNFWGAVHHRHPLYRALFYTTSFLGDSFSLVFCPRDHITIGISIKARTPPESDRISKLAPATIIPDMAPPVAPPKAIRTSTVPCVLARVKGSVESTIKAVPLINPKFQPRPSKISETFIRNKESPGAVAATTPEASNVTPEEIAIVSLPNLSTRIPVKGEGRYMAAIWKPITSPTAPKLCP